MANNYISDLTTPEAIQRIWEKGIIVDGYNASLYRQDFAGAWISREAYGDTDNILGWEIDHVYPEELGGGNKLENLRPMNWRNNRSKGTDYPHYTAVVTSEENKNIYRDTACTVSDALQTTLQKLYNI